MLSLPPMIKLSTDLPQDFNEQKLYAQMSFHREWSTDRAVGLL